MEAERITGVAGVFGNFQDALDGVAVEPFEDQRTHAKSFQSPEGEYALLCPLYDCLGVFGT